MLSSCGVKTNKEFCLQLYSSKQNLPITAFLWKTNSSQNNTNRNFCLILVRFLHVLPTSHFSYIKTRTLCIHMSKINIFFNLVFPIRTKNVTSFFSLILVYRKASFLPITRIRHDSTHS